MAYYYDESGGMVPQKPPKKESDLGSWVWIAVLFAIGLWPIGLFLLISKLTDDNDRRKKTAAKMEQARAATESKVSSAYKKMTKTPQYGVKGTNILKWVGVAMTCLGLAGIAGALGDISFYAHAGLVWELLSGLFIPTGLVVGGIATLLGGRNMQRRQRRFAKYLTVAGSDKAISLQRLARAAEVSPRKLEKDLEIMVEKGMWGEEAYVDVGAGMLFRTRIAAAQYDARTAATRENIPQEAAQGYSGMLRQIRAANDRIADPVLSQKIDRLEEIAGRILRLVESDPTRKAKAGTFLNYYLPTTQKLLDSYAEFEEAGVSGTNLDQAKAKIEKTMDNIIQGFEKQLDDLYRDDAMDIDSDIQVMETMLRRDGASVEDDFGLGGSTAVQEE